MVKPIQTAESFTGSSIVLLEETRERWVGQQCEVVAVGDPELCEDEDCERPHSWEDDFYATAPHQSRRYHPREVAVGDWCVVRPRSYSATDVENRWIVRQRDVLAILTQK